MSNINITQGQLDSIVTAINNRAKTSIVETKTSAMTKAQFNALAEERKANRSGSGFDEWGKHYLPDEEVNDGITTKNTYVNYFTLGRIDSDGAGVSKTAFPITCINGVTNKLVNVATSSIVSLNQIQLPTSPNIYSFDTVLTTEQINSGVIKHADASNSGLVVNGKFDTDTSGWTAINGAILSTSNQRLRIAQTGTDYGGAKQTINVIAGKQYIMYIDIDNSQSIYNTYVTISGLLSSTTRIDISTGGLKRYTYTFTPTVTGNTELVILLNSTVDGYIEFDNIAVYPADAISRSDLVFLESWHEDIAEKNIVYPLGNVQYLGGNTDELTGIANGSFSGFETYSLFGKWQTPSTLIGKGYVWSNLTEAQKKAFIANPENNCYLDGDKVIQVRFRVRVLMGEDTNSMAKATVQGKSVVPSSVLYTAPVTTVDAGLYSNTSTTYGYDGKVNAISIALVHRRNQGGYNATFNPNGTKTMTMTPTSISDCFNPANYTATTGYIGTSTSRPNGLFYDQISVEDFKPTNKGADLRNSSKKRTAQNIIEEFAPKVIAGTLLYNNNDTTALTTYKDYFDVRDTSGNRYFPKNKIGNVVTIQQSVANKKGFSVVTQNGKQYLQVADDSTNDDSVQLNTSVVKYDIGVFDAI